MNKTLFSIKIQNIWKLNKERPVGKTKFYQSDGVIILFINKGT